jgi:hypothetical protein
MALGSTQPLTEMSARSISCEFRRLLRRAVNLTAFMYQLSRHSGSLNLLETSWPVQACIGTALPFDVELC